MLACGCSSTWSSRCASPAKWSAPHRLMDHPCHNLRAIDMKLPQARQQPCDLEAGVQLAKLERKLGEEEEGRRQDVAKAEARIRSLEGELAAEHRRRLSEQLRALVQGAPFIFHKAHSAEQRTIWFRCAPCWNPLCMQSVLWGYNCKCVNQQQYAGLHHLLLHIDIPAHAAAPASALG